MCMHVHNKSFWCLYVVCTICGTYIVLKIKAYAGSALEVDLAPSRWGFARIENDSSHQASKCEISREMFLPFLASFDARFMQDLCEMYDFYARDHLSGAVQVPKEDQSATIVEGSLSIE